MKPFFTGTLSSGLQSPRRTVNPDWHVGYHESHSCSESCCQTATGPWSKGGEMSPPWPHQCWVGKGRAHFARVRESNQHCKNMVSVSRFAALLTCPSWLPRSASSPLWETLKIMHSNSGKPHLPLHHQPNQANDLAFAASWLYVGTRKSMHILSLTHGCK